MRATLCFSAPARDFVLGFDIGRANGWQRWILGDIEINECPGDHSSMCEQPHVRVLARRLKSYLQRQVRDTKVRDAEAPRGCDTRLAAATATAELRQTYASDQS